MGKTASLLSGLLCCLVVSAASVRHGYGATQAAQHEHGVAKPEQHQHGVRKVQSESCDLGIEFEEAAEHRRGGALYTQATVAMQAGVTGEQHMQHAQDHGAQKGTQPVAEMHELHDPQHGGKQFFMAPNKLHHVEPVYSERCGLRVILYNAHSEPIRPDRFRALVRVIPSVEVEPERMRFLEISADGAVLEADLGPELSRPFEAELYVRFPENDEPELFNVLVTPEQP